MSVTELFPVVVLKKILCWLIYRQWIETISDCGRKIRNDVDTDVHIIADQNSYHDDKST